MEPVALLCQLNLVLASLEQEEGDMDELERDAVVHEVPLGYHLMGQTMLGESTPPRM